MASTETLSIQERLALVKKRREMREAELQNAANPAPQTATEEKPADAHKEDENNDENNPNGSVDYRSIWVGSLDSGIRDQNLKDYFSACGTVERATVLIDPHTKRSKCYGYVEFATREGVENALKLDGHLLSGKGIKIKEKRKNQPGMGIRRRFSRSRR